ncbi:hypothetical protein CGMCC3_g17971 [Colletotrichum fructicola]|nr:uncharacterized protein CGMCC3_g17971 [Colletotrichum fructicola]KAE9565850.1 hypothetical protein CGMCC3_g17971 [Colletotrichum fructicola]
MFHQQPPSLPGSPQLQLLSHLPQQLRTNVALYGVMCCGYFVRGLPWRSEISESMIPYFAIVFLDSTSKTHFQSCHLH